MGSSQHGVNIFEDNRSTIAICTNNMRPGNSRSKHVDLKIKCLEDNLQKGDIMIHHVPTKLNMTDILTKALPRETFVRCIVNALKPDDILPPIPQNEGSAEQDMISSFFLGIDLFDYWVLWLDYQSI